jgi:hypothetical protein
MNTEVNPSLSQSGGKETEPVNRFQGLTLSEWVFVGQETGRIRNLETVVLASRMKEVDVLAWMADIVLGRVSEDTAVWFMRRALQLAL